MFTVIVAGSLLPNERITLNKFVGIIVDFIGVIVMIGGDALTYLGGGVVAQFAILDADISHAFHRVMALIQNANHR